MIRSVLILLSLCLLSAGASAQLRSDGATASFRGALPPKPVADISSEQEAALTQRLQTLSADFAAVQDHPHAADAEIFLKAVRYALEFREWYDKTAEGNVRKAETLLTEAASRIAALHKKQTPWMDGPGWKVLGFYSQIDGSPQPYAVEVPQGLKWGDAEKAVPLWLWLHGRGDTATDLHFIAGKLGSTKPGQFQPAGTLVVHPFGRYCNGWKSAGETDVFEVRDEALTRFHGDPDRVALAGFSMGGAGAWHLGAHFADQWACVHAGAGFVDVKRYQKLTPEKMPPWYEQKLWGVYDVPAYARNFFNVPLVVYSGEEDTQRDAAAYMGEVLAAEGLTMRHHIGPGMGHKYHPEVIKTVQAEIESAVAQGRDPMPAKVILQTRTLGYSSLFWVRLTRQEKPWQDTRIEAERGDKDIVRVKTKNVLSFTLNPDFEPKGVEIDGTLLTGSDLRDFSRDSAGKWQVGAAVAADAPQLKRAGQSGPIEEPLKRPFLVVLPETDSASPQVTAWVNAEADHFLSRWRSLMRGDARVKKAEQVTADDMLDYTLVLWGDAKSNPVIARILDATGPQRLPFTWDAATLKMGITEVSSASHVPVLIYPNPLQPKGTVILNSGLTFREAHDRTNSLQNPKLPDWAILDITQPPDSESPGRIVAADFFDDLWQVRPPAESLSGKN